MLKDRKKSGGDFENAAGAVIQAKNVRITTHAEFQKAEAERMQDPAYAAQKERIAQMRAERLKQYGGGNEPPSGGSDRRDGDSGSGGNVSARRPFDYERHPHYQWLSPDQYDSARDSNSIKKAPWGRFYHPDAIERMQPSQLRFKHEGEGKHKPPKRRSIANEFVEYTIGYGERIVDEKGDITYKSDEVEVGLNEARNLVYHIAYKHNKK